MTINVKYSVYGSTWGIRNMLDKLYEYPTLSLDTEVKGIYTKEERKEALKLLDSGTLNTVQTKSASLIARNSGLSFPSITEVTHFIFGVSREESIIFITDSAYKEMIIWEWLAEAKNYFIVHNALFDLKIMYNRVGCILQNYDDTALMIKTLINHVNTWKASVKLKELMGSYYDPAWTLIDEYEPENLYEPKFLRYSSIDGAATFYLKELIDEQVKNETTD